MEKKVIMLPFFDVEDSKDTIENIIGQEGEFLVYNGNNYAIKSLWKDAYNNCTLSSSINIADRNILSYDTLEKYRLETLNNKLAAKTKELNECNTKYNELLADNIDLRIANKTLIDLIKNIMDKNNNNKNNHE